MKSLTVEVMNSAEALARFSKSWKGAAAGKSIDATVAVASMAELTALVSPKRMELLSHVARNPGLSIRALAKALGRDYKNVHTDVTELESRQLLERDARGMVEAPYDELAIRATLRQAA